MPLAFITSPALLLAVIAGTGALLGGVIVWARNRQRRRGSGAGRPGDARHTAAEPSKSGQRDRA